MMATLGMVGWIMVVGGLMGIIYNLIYGED